MASERSSKRQKTALESQTNAPSTPPSQIPLPAEPVAPSLASSTESSANPAQSSSWYASWSRKAPPIAKAARESLKSASDAAIDIASSIKDVPAKPRSIRSPSLAMTLGKGRASRASLADVTTTMVHAEANSPSRRSTKSLSISSKDTREAQEVVTKAEDTKKVQPDATVLSEQPVQEIEPVTNTQQDSQNQRSSWIGWLARGENLAGSEHKSVQGSTPPISVQEQPSSQPEMQEVALSEVPQETPLQETASTRRGWLSIWPGENNTKSGTETPIANVEDGAQNPSNSKSKESTVQSEQVKIQESPSVRAEETPKEEPAPPVLPHDTNKASGWVFWSRERKANDSSVSVSGPQEGEIAISDTPSQTKPRKASISVADAKPEMKSEMRPDEAQKVNNTEKVAEKKSSKAGESSSTTTSKKSEQQTTPSVTKAESSNATAIAAEPVENTKPASVASGKSNNNLLLPTLYSTLKPVESPSLLLRLANMLYAPREPDFRHLSLVKDPPRIKNALAIGVHGYFPTPLIRSVLGQPTGTSIKFADMAAKSIKKWTSGQGYECSVKSAALEGEGKIAERLELLWKLLLNWIEEIRKSDFIMVACHSQGVPVAIMLVARLIQFGCVNSATICICAMAGVNMGPFLELKSRWIGGSAGELFEFSDPSSRVSVDYLSALDVVLKFGARLTFIGSIDDQLVSLESSIYAPITHPHIFRAVSIDSRVHAPNFLSHLVGFALKLRNLGVQDHGLIRELSSPLAGSLYTGEGHSRIYEDDAVYDLAVSFALETNLLAGLPLSKRAVAAGGNNPYILPFAMRGILEEDYVKNELQEEAADLLKEFDEWKPTSKVLKDVKFRLEGIRSQL